MIARELCEGTLVPVVERHGDIDGRRRSGTGREVDVRLPVSLIQKALDDR